MSMRIVYVGNFEPSFSTENDVKAALLALGHEVDPLQENTVTPATFDRATGDADLVLWTSTWEDTPVAEHAKRRLPELEAAGVPSAAYHLDIFHRVARGGRDWRANPMWSCTGVFTADGTLGNDWEAMGIDHQWLRPGVRHTAVGFGQPVAEYACDVAFVGSDGRGYHPEWPYRAELVDFLERLCAERGWTFRNPGGRHPKVERDHRMNDFYASAKVTVGDSLCLDRKQARYWSDRAYEAPGRGGLLIMPSIRELSHDYGGALPMYPWGDFDGLAMLIEHYLDNPEARVTVREDTQRIVAERHTYMHRMTELLDVMGVS